MRLAVYTDHPYRRGPAGLEAHEAFSLFVASLADYVDELTMVGRLDPDPGWEGYEIGAAVRFEELPFYPDLARAGDAGRSFGESCRRFWRLLGRVDGVWLMGPHPMSIAFALLALVRGKRVTLGVRQDLPSYVAGRHPGRRAVLGAAWALELTFRGLALLFPTVVVGPALARKYRHARRLLEIAVSLIADEDIVSLEEAVARSYEGELVAISVGRLDPEKNPLLLAEILVQLRATGRPWRLLVCGDGRLREDLAHHLAELGVAEHAELRGYVPYGPALSTAYRESHALLHVSWTEGFPQVILEGFAAGLPVVATDVGGVRAAADGAARLVEPGNAGAS
ncbi:MAG TPA: glycosyltransferase, partial [Rubrobacter sp.]|nr:glycosyltransferase [Rubrobacter sp.]